jgi:hypothetical protein
MPLSLSLSLVSFTLSYSLQSRDLCSIHQKSTSTHTLLPLLDFWLRTPHAGALLFALPLSSDKTIAVIDWSSMLVDLVGINREELVRLAKLQVPIEHFDKSKLSEDRYLIRIEDQDIKLPCMSSCDQSWVVDDAFCF